MAAITRSPGHLKFDDNLRLYFGSGAGPSDAGDVYIVHDGSTFSIVGASLSMPSLIISDTAGIRLNDSAPLKFGTPGTDMVFTPNGTDVIVTSTGALVFNDSVDLYIGTGKDLRLYHNGTDSFINSILGTAKLRIGLPNTDGTSSFYIEQTGANPLLTITSDAQWASYIKDNSTTAYIIAEAGNNYFKIDTSNAGALMIYGNTTTFPTHSMVGILTSDDAVASGPTRRVGGRVDVATAAGTSHTGSTDETVLKSYSVPANTFKAGTVLEVTFGARVTADNGATTLTGRLRLGTTTLTGTELIVTAALDTSSAHYFSGRFTVISRAAPSASSSLTGIGHSFIGAIGASGAATVQQALPPTNFATNGALLLELTADWSAADANAVQMEHWEVRIVG